MKLKIGSFLFFLGLCLVGCGKKEIVGTEKIAAQARTVSPFSSLKVSGYYNVNVTIAQPQSVVVKVNGNLLPYIDTTVKGKTLTIQSKKGYILRPQGIPEVDITTPTLANVELSGNNQVNLKNFTGESLDLNFSGSNQLVGQGTVNTLNMTISGNTVVDTQKLMTNKVTIDSTGNSKVTVNAKDTMNITISGNGVINYSGNPKIDQTINGSGTISKMQETINK